MSLNHLIENNEPLQNKINIECNDLKPRGELLITCLNEDKFVIKPPTRGLNGEVLQSTGDGGVFWGASTGSSGMSYQGITPVSIGSHYKISNTVGSECSNSKLVETTNELALTNLNITNAGLYNSTIINDGNIESTGTSDLDLVSVSGTIRLWNETSVEDNKIINCLNPTNPNDVATKNYVDTQAGLSYTGSQPTIVGQLLKFDSTTGSGVDKSVMVETATNLNLGLLNIVDVGTVDGVNIDTFKSDYDSKVNQNVKTTANVVFASVTTPSLTYFGNDMVVNGLVFTPRNIYGGELISGDLNIHSTTNTPSGIIRLHDEVSLESNKIINCSTPTNPTDVATKSYVDAQISSTPTIAYDLLIPLTSETGAVNSTGIKYKFYPPRTFTLLKVDASLNTPQTSGNAITINIQSGGANILNPASGLSFINQQAISNSPTFVSNPTVLVSSQPITITITQFGDGTAVGLKIMFVGTQ